MALTHAKMENNKGRAGLADLETKLGFTVIDKKESWLKIGAAIVTPTGNRPTGEFVFEPICGNGQHWEFGGFIDTKYELWTDYQSSLALNAQASCLYGLKSTEKRTLGIQKDDGSSVPFGHYYLVGQRGLRYFFPFANVSTQELDVTPGVHCQALVNLAFTFKGINIDCGYNLFAKQKETVKLKYPWQDDMYAIAYDDHATNTNYFMIEQASGAFDATAIDGNILGKHPIQWNNIDLRSATTPAQITHKFYGAISHTTSWKTPLLCGIGAAYELGSSNTSIDAYSAWFNASVAF
jgi:hypothetical protein